MTKRMITLLAAILLMVGMTAAPALANQGQGQGQGQGNSDRSVAEPVDLDADDITDQGDFYRIQHGLGDDCEFYTWREPARIGGQTSDPAALAGFDTLWLGVDEDGDPVDHKGQVSVYYDCDEDGVKSIVSQFNGKGELLRVNGVKFEG